jgi:hypothetical protein
LSSPVPTPRARLYALAAIGVLTIAAACSSDSTGPSTGTLTVTVTTPAGVTGNITVTGPSGYSKTVTATQTLTGLPTGSYTVVGTTVVIAATIVGNDTNTATVTGSPATVGKNQTATVTVAYAAGSPTGGLWIANGQSTSNEFVSFSAAQLGASGSPTPVAGMVGQSSVAVAFDRQGNLWAITNGGTIVEYTAAQLDTPTATPRLTLSIAGAQSVSALAFDSAGNLWTVDQGPCNFFENSAATLANHTGAQSLSPDLEIKAGCSGPAGNPIVIAFDAHWNLWVSDTLKVGFSGHYAARVIGGLTSAGNLAFDASGNLWTTTQSNDSIFAYSASQLTDTTTAPRPQVAVAVSTSSISSYLMGLAFDNSGDLWTVDGFSNKAYELSTSQLTASATVTPAVTIGASSGSLAQPLGLAFAPHSSGLPLFSHAPPALTRGRTHSRTH